MNPGGPGSERSTGSCGSLHEPTRQARHSEAGHGLGDPGPRLLQDVEGQKGEKKKIFVELMELKFCKGREGDSQSAGRFLHGLSDWFS